jgi:O-antigen ligase
MTTRSISVILCFWLLVIPLSFNIWGLDPALYSKFLLLDISLLIAAVWSIAESAEIRISKGFGVFILLYALYISLSVIGLILYGINPADGCFVWLHLFTLPVFILLLFVVDSRVGITRDQVSFIISCLALVSIAIGVVQYVDEVLSHHWYLAASDAMRSTYAHKNIFAEVLLLTLPFSVYAGFFGGKRLLSRIISTLTFLTILLLLSRAVWIGMGVATLVTIAIYFIASRRWLPRWYHVLGIFIGMAVCYFMYDWFIWHTNVGDRLADFYQKRDTIRERKHLWTATWQMIKLHPLFGNGLGSWKILNMRYGIVGLRDYATFFQQPHNDYLWVISEQGFAAFIAAGAAWVWVLYRLMRQLYAKPSDAFLYCLLFALVGYGVYANLAFPKERAEHMIILALITFFILSDEVRDISLSRYILWPVCIVLVACTWWSANKITGEMHLRDFFEARARNDIGKERTELDAISATYTTVDGTATPIAWYRGMLNFTQGNVAEASKDFDQAVTANPYHLYSLCNVGTCRNMRGDKAGAIKYFRLALDCAPGFPDAALNLCAIRYNEGQLDSAAMYLGMANDTLADPRYIKSLSVLTQDVKKIILDSAQGDSADAFHRKVSDMSKNVKWQADIFKKAYIHCRTVKEQTLKDIFWSLRYQDHDSISAEYYEKQFKQSL